MNEVSNYTPIKYTPSAEVINRDKYRIYVQSAKGLVYMLKLKPIGMASTARTAVQALRDAVAEDGEQVFADCKKRVSREANTASLGLTSVWYEKVRNHV